MLEGFGLFQRRWRPGDEGFEKIAAVAIDAFVSEDLEVFHCVTEIGKRRAGEVKGVTVEFEDDFYDVGIRHDRIVRIERIGGRDHVQTWISAEGCRELIDEFGVDERFVALDIENVCGLGNALDGLGESVGSGGMIRRGHHRFAAEMGDGFCNAFVIGCDDDFRKFRGEFTAFPNVLDEWFTSDEVKRFSGEAGGAPASRKDADDVGFGDKQ